MEEEKKEIDSGGVCVVLLSCIRYNSPPQYHIRRV